MDSLSLYLVRVDFDYSVVSYVFTGLPTFNFTVDCFLHLQADFKVEFSHQEVDFALEQDDFPLHSYFPYLIFMREIAKLKIGIKIETVKSDTGNPQRGAEKIAD